MERKFETSSKSSVDHLTVGSKNFKRLLSFTEGILLFVLIENNKDRIRDWKKEFQQIRLFCIICHIIKSGKIETFSEV